MQYFAPICSDTLAVLDIDALRLLYHWLSNSLCLLFYIAVFILYTCLCFIMCVHIMSLKKVHADKQCCFVATTGTDLWWTMASFTMWLFTVTFLDACGFESEYRKFYGLPVRCKMLCLQNQKSLRGYSSPLKCILHVKASVSLSDT